MSRRHIERERERGQTLKCGVAPFSESVFVFRIELLDLGSEIVTAELVLKGLGNQTEIVGIFNLNFLFVENGSQIARKVAGEIPPRALFVNRA